MSEGFSRLLRVYPRPWRDAHGAALLGVMLDVADAEGRDRPTAREGMAVVRHAARTWVDAGADRLRRSGTAASLTSIGGGALVLGSTLSALSLLFGEWFGGVDLLWGDDFHAAPFGPFPSSGPMLYVLWFVALGAFLAGASRVARLALALAAVGGPVLYVVSDVAGVGRPPVLLLATLTIFALTAFVTLPSPDGDVRRRLGLVTATAVGAMSAVLLAVTLAGLTLPVTFLYAGIGPRLDVREPGNADYFLGVGFYRYFGLGTLVWVALPVVVGWLIWGLVTVWTHPGRALAAGVLGVPLLAVSVRTVSNLPLPGSLQGEGVLLLLALGLLAVSLSLLVMAVRTVRAGSGMTGAAA